MKVKLSVFSLLMIMLNGTAFAGWQNDGYYIRDGHYVDDGSRFVMGLRGGISLAKAKMKNEIGTLEATYYGHTSGSIRTELSLKNAGVDIYDDADLVAHGYTPLGVGDVGALPVKKGFSKTAFTAGGSIGFVVPYHPQWRLEADYDHISEMNYNETPFLEGDIPLSGIYGTAHVFSSGVTSTITTDIISVMAFHDFFEGRQKQLDTLIPYVGFGIGYAISRTTLKLVDVYGDLSEDRDLQNYGTPGNDDVIVFADPSLSEAPTSSNIALVGSLGASYGISKYTFLDIGFRLMYVPKITWQLVNDATSSHRDWFAAKDMLYSNFMVGLRFEF